MGFFVYHRYGECESDPPAGAFALLLDELEDRPDDEEHGSVSVVRESEWSLEVMPGFHLVLEHAEGEGAPRYMDGVPRAKLLEMMAALANGDLAALEREPWRPGY